MNAKLYGLEVLLFLSLAAGEVSAQIYNPKVIGYYTTAFAPGNNLFDNQLEDDPDTLSTLFFQAPVPNGTTISLWNSTTSSYDTKSTFSGGSWSIDLTLQPGSCALLNTMSAFTNTFIGNVLNHDGSLYNGGKLLPPPVFSGANGIYLLGDKCITADTGTNIFINILGRLPNTGEQVTLLNNVSQTYTTSTYIGNGNWDNVPTLGLGDAALFNIESVPEPNVFSLLNICALFICWRIKWPNIIRAFQ
jgi:hypothetical protein